MHGRRLKSARERFVTPFYLGSLRVDALKDPERRAEFLKACSSLDTESAHVLLDEPEWRGRKVAATEQAQRGLVDYLER